jgi:hypothetical protein
MSLKSPNRPDGLIALPAPTPPDMRSASGGSRCLRLRCRLPRRWASAAAGTGLKPRWRQHPARRPSLNWKPLPVDRDAERAHPAGALDNLAKWRPGPAPPPEPRPTSVMALGTVAAQAVWLRRWKPVTCHRVTNTSVSTKPKRKGRRQQL